MRPIVTKKVDGKPVEVPLSEAWPALMRLVQSIGGMMGSPPNDMTFAGYRHGVICTRGRDLDGYTLGWAEEPDKGPAEAIAKTQHEENALGRAIVDEILKGLTTNAKVPDELVSSPTGGDLANDVLTRGRLFEVLRKERDKLAKELDGCRAAAKQWDEIRYQRDRYHTALCEILASIEASAKHGCINGHTTAYLRVIKAALGMGEDCKAEAERKPPQGGRGHDG